ncbi:carboxyl transferase domain-containing protein [Saccharopolyspora sp. NPDC003752]
MQGEEGLRALLPDRPQRAYDVKPVIRGILDQKDDGTPDFEELQAKWAPNIVVGLGRLGGRSVGVVANNALRKGGCLDSLSAEKAGRFVRMCDSFGVPLLVREVRSMQARLASACLLWMDAIRVRRNALFCWERWFCFLDLGTGSFPGTTSRSGHGPIR